VSVDRVGHGLRQLGPDGFAPAVKVIAASLNNEQKGVGSNPVEKGGIK
jgi:hypothetical protein